MIGHDYSEFREYSIEKLQPYFHFFDRHHTTLILVTRVKICRETRHLPRSTVNENGKGL